MANTNKAIFTGDAARQRAETFKEQNGGIVLPARRVIRIVGDDQTSDMGSGFVVVPRKPKSGVVKVKNFEATL
jgi:hypothetical protein